MVNGTVQIENQQYTIQPVLADRLTYVLLRNYEKTKDPFASYFGYESVTNCTDPTTINWSEKCSKMGFICSDEIDSFHKMTLRIVLNFMRSSWGYVDDVFGMLVPDGHVKNQSPTSQTCLQHSSPTLIWANILKWSGFPNGKLVRIPHGAVKRRRPSKRCTPLYQQSKFNTSKKWIYWSSNGFRWS